MFDVEQTLRYPFEDEKWVEKILIGGALNVIPIINLFSLGYTLESMRAGTRGEMTLPVWEDWGDKFIAGLMVFVISFVYMLIPGLIMLLGGAGGVMGMRYYGDVGMGIVGVGLVLLTFMIGLVLCFFLPMAIAHFAAENRIGAAFEFGEIWRRTRTVFGEYLVAIVLFVVFSMVLGMIGVIPVFGWIIFIFGVFYLGVVFANLVGRLYYQAGKSTIIIS